jgi:peroxiredoxin
MFNQDTIMQICLGVQYLLLGCAALTLFSAAVHLVLGLTGWRGPYRNRRWKRFALSLVAIPILVGAQWLNVWVGLEVMAYTQQSERIERHHAASLIHVGDLAPDFDIVDTQGYRFSISENRGKLILVNFFATWCGPCVMELPHIQKIWDQHQSNDDFRLIVIGREETNESVNSSLKEKDFTFSMAADPERNVYSQFAKELIPRNYLIGPDGKICFSTTGFDEEELLELSEEITHQLDAIR